ncbi:MAG: ribosome maturation factor RimP [Clostridiales bacterium]|jgi:ribosome maturation factor RimP|nr:ribosome maturation factor RimP [Clostridiales bacterium]
MSKIVDIVTNLAKPVVEQAGCTLWDVEYVKEAGQWHLRVYIDKDEGISIEDCENVSRALDPILDEKDPIEDSYVFEVSSAGLERTLKRPEHFARFIGNTVEVKLYKAQNGAKVFSGTLMRYENGNVTIESENGEATFLKEQVAAVRISLL